MQMSKADSVLLFTKKYLLSCLKYRIPFAKSPRPPEPQSPRPPPPGFIPRPPFTGLHLAMLWEALWLALWCGLEKVGEGAGPAESSLSQEPHR